MFCSESEESYDTESAAETNDDQLEQGEILIPSYINTPDYDDICALKWGKEHYIRFFPSLKRKPFT
jgi:hypothetical protein